jgi:hypothetical protein
MPRLDSFGGTFAALRGVLEANAKGLIVTVDKPGDYQRADRTLTDRIGRPLFVAAVQTRKNYVSFHLLPMYGSPDLVAELSPALRKRMQGKACFNFRTIDAVQLKELRAVTRKGITRLKKIALPWARPA